MTIHEIVLAIAGVAVILVALIVAITFLVQVMKKDRFRYRRTPQEQVDEYAMLNDVIPQ